MPDTVELVGVIDSTKVAASVASAVTAPFPLVNGVVIEQEVAAASAVQIATEEVSVTTPVVAIAVLGLKVAVSAPGANPTAGLRTAALTQVGLVAATRVYPVCAVAMAVSEPAVI